MSAGRGGCLGPGGWMDGWFTEAQWTCGQDLTSRVDVGVVSKEKLCVYSEMAVVGAAA